ncbi:AAA family ATPase [Dactylosporangium sp. NPDC049525]|uniref:helix-turn-helix transcriptional regulator n=1 Tax=Dactylosporangium sp. NPDC049525 TaxID=3154730 RepID=UPI00342D2906
MTDVVPPGPAAGPLVGRDTEQQLVAALLRSARDRRGAALLVTGDAGIGKTALMEAAVAGPIGFQVLRLNGYEAESTMPFAAVHRLVIALREHVGTLPRRQQTALSVACGEDGPPPDRFLVGLGVLGLLAAAGSVQPVVCAVDDAHLLDAESLDALAVVARRLEAESVALLLAARDDPAVTGRLAGVGSLRLTGLPAEPAARLLASVLGTPVDPVTAARIVEATGGNPLALVDLANELTVRELTGTGVFDEPVPVGRRLEAFYLRQVRRAAADLQRWLLLAAADPTGDVALIRAAAARLGLAHVAGDEPDAAGLVELGATVRFRHPLVRSATYAGATGPERRRTHQALSAAADGLALAELAAWHAAKATVGPDADVADRLEAVANRAGQRGGFRSRASLLTQASGLTPPGPVKDGRLVMAAEAAMTAGAAGLADSLMGEVDEATLDPAGRGRLITVRVNHAFLTADPTVLRSPADMIAAAGAFHGLDPAAEQHALIKAFGHAVTVDRLGTAVPLTELGHRLMAGAALRDGVAGTILRALGTYVLRPYPEAVPALRAAVAALDGTGPADLLRFGPIGVAVTAALWDETAMRRCLQRTEAAARDLGSVYLLDSILWLRSLSALRTETPRAAQRHADQARELRRAMGNDAGSIVNVALLTWSGHPRSQVEAIIEQARATGFGAVYASGVGALAAQDLAAGHYRAAYVRLKPLVDEPFLQATPLDYPDFVEAAARAGQVAQAEAFATRLEAFASASGAAWARGVAHRSRALVSADELAEAHYTAAIATFAPTVLAIELGRAHLLYGEWLRRMRRRKDAREQLRRALVLFDDGDAPAFAQRARGELEATGERPAGPAGAGHGLTPQEMAVARLAATGNTNAEVGAMLFISANTVDYHLRKVFQKLAITSRRQLAARFGDTAHGDAS